MLIRDMSRFYDGIKYQWRPRRELHVRAYNPSHVSDAALLHDLSALVAQDRITTASLLAHIAEVDARRLCQPAGSSSMFEYCTGVPEDSRPVPEPVLFDGAKPPGEQEHAHSPQADSPSPPHESPPPARFMVRVEIDESTHDKLRHAQALLSHAVPSGDVELVLERALDALIVLLEKRKFAAKFRSRRSI